jgi:hypothetical protein
VSTYATSWRHPSEIIRHSATHAYEMIWPVLCIACGHSASAVLGGYVSIRTQLSRTFDCELARFVYKQMQASCLWVLVRVAAYHLTHERILGTAYKQAHRKKSCITHDLDALVQRREAA